MPRRIPGEAPPVAGFALGTPQDEVLADQEQLQTIQLGKAEASYRAAFSAEQWGMVVSGEDVFRFEDALLVGGERHIRYRKGPDDHEFFREVYLRYRRDLVDLCEGELSQDEWRFRAGGDDWTPAYDYQAVPPEVWNGERRWSARCEEPGLVMEVRLENRQGVGAKPHVIWSVRRQAAQ